MDDYVLAIHHLEARLIELDVRLSEIAETDPYRERVGWLRCFRGIDTLTAMLLLAELHDFQRFPSAPALMAYVGLVPSEDSSGEKHRRGRITRTGNALVRRLLVETAWHYQHRPSIGVGLTRRRKDQPGRVIAIADKAIAEEDRGRATLWARAGRRIAREPTLMPSIAIDAGGVVLRVDAACNVCRSVVAARLSRTPAIDLLLHRPERQFADVERPQDATSTSKGSRHTCRGCSRRTLRVQPKHHPATVRRVAIGSMDSPAATSRTPVVRRRCCSPVAGCFV